MNPFKSMISRGSISPISKESKTLLENQGKYIKILDEIKGEDIIGKMVLDVYGIKEIPILPGNFVDTATATGVVYSVPAHAPYDYIALNDLQKNKQLIKRFNLDEEEIGLIEPLLIIDLKGFTDFPAKIYCEKHKVDSQQAKEELDQATNDNYKNEYYNGVLNDNCGKYTGMKVNDAAKQVANDLIKENRADKLYLPVTKNLKCRCGTEVIVAILKDQWFLNFQAGDWKKDAFKCLGKMKIIPKKYRLYFENIFNWLEKRPCARKRGIGTKLPFDREWIIESLSDSTIYMAFYTISHKIKENQIKPEQLTPEFFDYVYLEKGDVNELSNNMGVDVKTLNEMQSEFLYWYPVDHRHTAIMHISNHLSFYIFHHVAIFPEEKWPKLISLIEPVIIEGEKMGKSKGNVISLSEILKTYGADLFRFYISQNADFSAYMDFRRKEIEAVRNHILKFLRFMEDKIECLKVEQVKYENIKFKYSQVIISLITKKFVEAEKSLEGVNIRRYLQVSFYETFNQLQDFFRISRNEKDKLGVIQILFPTWIQLLSFTIPHLCEELWERIGNTEFISTIQLLNIKEEHVRDDLEEEFAYITSLVEDILNIKKIIKSTRIKVVYIYIAPKWKYDLQNIIHMKKGNFKSIMNELENKKEIVKNKQTISYIKNQIKDRIWESKLSQIDEYILINEYMNYIETRVSNKIIINSDFDPQLRSIKATPFKPAIYIKSTK